MKTILASMTAGSLLAIIAPAQSPHLYRRGFPDLQVHRARDCRPFKGHLVYVITGGFQFGIVDLASGAFVPIGSGLPPDVGAGLVPGPARSLLTLGFSGNLDAIDPGTGNASTVGATGPRDCSMGSDAPDCPNVIGRLDGNCYVTDFANNFYSVEPKTGPTKLIGATGLPAITFIPFGENPDGSVNVYGENLFSGHGKLYATFATVAINFATGTYTSLIPGALHTINPKTGTCNMDRAH